MLLQNPMLPVDQLANVAGIHRRDGEGRFLLEPRSLGEVLAAGVVGEAQASRALGSALHCSSSERCGFSGCCVALFCLPLLRILDSGHRICR